MYQAGASKDPITLTQIVGKNENIAAELTTQVGNTSMNVMAVVSGYYEDP